MQGRGASPVCHPLVHLRLSREGWQPGETTESGS